MSTRKPAIKVYALRQPFVAFEARLWRPAHNLYETDRGVMLVVDLAGIDPANLHIHLHPHHVAVHGARQLSVPQGIRRIAQMEIGAGPFELEVPLPRPIDPDRAEARYADGLLEIGLPFSEQAEQRVIVIKIDGGAA